MSSKTGIIIPSYNQGKYLEKTIQSVLENQRHADIEIALMDGGSQDESIEIIEKYHPYFSVWVSEPDNGQADAINKGIQALPNCKYYMWLNSDDVYNDEFAVKKIVEFADSRGYDVCYGLSHFINEQGQPIGEYPVEPFDKENLGKRCYLSQPSVLFSKKAYDTVGPLNKNLKMCLDYEYWIRLSQDYNFGYLKEYIGSTRIYGETKTSTQQQQHLKEAVTILMKYYGNVPMHWIVTKVLADHPHSFLQYIPKRLLLLGLYPIKGRIIKECLEGNVNA